MNHIVNDKKGHNIVNDSFSHKSDGLLVILGVGSVLIMLNCYPRLIWFEIHIAFSFWESCCNRMWRIIMKLRDSSFARLTENTLYSLRYFKMHLTLSPLAINRAKSSNPLNYTQNHQWEPTTHCMDYMPHFYEHFVRGSHLDRRETIDFCLCEKNAKYDPAVTVFWCWVRLRKGLKKKELKNRNVTPADPGGTEADITLASRF